MIRIGCIRLLAVPQFQNNLFLCLLRYLKWKFPGEPMDIHLKLLPIQPILALRESSHKGE